MVLENDIRGIKTRLRTALPGDAEYTFLLRQNTELNKYVHKISGTIADQKKWIEIQMEKEDSFFFLATDEYGKPLGTAAVYDIDTVAKFGVTGRTVLEGSQIQNLEIIYLLYDFAFGELGLEHIRTAAFEENLSAIGVTERFGGVCTGRQFIDSFGMNELIFSIKRDDYMKKKDHIVSLIGRFSARL